MGLPKAYHDQSAQQMLLKVLQPWIDLLRNDFEHGFQEIQRYDDMTFRQYLRSVVSLPHDVIDYIELIMSQTNQYDLSFTDLMMQTLHFNTPEWVTVKGGMSRMVDEAARLLGSACFRNAAVTEIVETDDGKVSLSVQGISTVRKQSFDKVSPNASAVIPGNLLLWKLAIDVKDRLAFRNAAIGPSWGR